RCPVGIAASAYLPAASRNCGGVLIQSTAADLRSVRYLQVRSQPTRRPATEAGRNRGSSMLPGQSLTSQVLLQVLQTELERSGAATGCTGRERLWRPEL